MPSPGLFLVIAGLVLVLIGALVLTGALSWFGHLPGDIRVERPGARVYVPLASCLILSVVVSLVLYVVRRFF